MKFFVSATTAGLGGYRKGAAAYISRLKRDAIEQAEIPGEISLIETKLRGYIGECDAVVCLIGRFFGCPCPSEGAGGCLKSYTQFEYEIASEVLKKPVILFFISDTASDLLDDSQPSEVFELQDAFRKRVREQAIASGREYYDAASLDEVNARLGEVVPRIDPSHPQLSGSPLPMVRAWESLSAPNAASGPIPTQNALDSVLALFTLAVTQAAILNGAEFSDRIPAHDKRQPDQWVKWKSLLADAAPHAGYFPEVPGWLKVNQLILDDFHSVFRDWDAARIENVEDEIRKHWQRAMDLVHRLSASLVWLENYVLAAASEADAGAAMFLILRGAKPISLHLPIAGPLPAGPDQKLFLLSLSRHLALPLWPALCCDSSMYPDQPVLAASLAADESSVSLRLRVLASQGKLQESSIKIGDGFLLEWLPSQWRNQRALQRFAASAPSLPPAATMLPLLTEEGWKKLDQAVRADPQRRRVLLNRKLELNPLERRNRVDIYASEPDAPTERRLLFYTLPAQLLNDESARNDLAHRHEYWSRIVSAPSVLKPLEQSNASPKDEFPFIAVEDSDDFVSLRSWLSEHASAPGWELTEKHRLALLRAAAKVCVAAHSAGLRVLGFSPDQILCAAGSGKLFAEEGFRFTGFDTLFPALPGDKPQRENPGAFLRRCGDHNLNEYAPELMDISREIPASADIFALGKLLLLLGAPAHPHPAGGHPHDPIEILVGHCTNIDPALRFQSAEHLLRLLEQDRWLHRGPEDMPAMTQVSGGEVVAGGRSVFVKGFEIGTYPVMNAEYGFFQNERARPPYRENRQRESGPWCPVTGISLDDAVGFCDALQNRHEGRWRLPSEAEWLRAAALGENRKFPWGNDEPDRTRANFGRLFHGPSIVGACAAGVSAAGCWDMAGNVWEWCTDFMGPGDPLRVLKGGAYDFISDSLRLDVRRGVVRTHRSPHVGFRVVHELD